MTDVEKKTGSEILEKPRSKERVEDLWKVVLHNDDYTPMEFVVDVLEVVFDKSPAEANRIMMQVHVDGRGIAGAYPHEVAETRAQTTIDLAREAGFPLLATVEEG